MLAFIDESGHPRPTDDTKRPVLLATCIKETKIRDLTSQIYKIKMDVYNKADVEVKATKLIHKKTLDNKHTKNKLFMDKLMQLISDFDIKVFAVIMEKPDFEPFVKEGILAKQYFYLMKKIELFCENYNHSMALIIFDEQDRNEDKKISVAFNNFLYQSALGKTFNKILEIPLFVNSEITPGVQLADLMAGIVRHYYEKELYEKNPETDFEKWLCDLYSIVRRKTENLKEKGTGYTEYGLFTMSKSKFPQTPEEIEEKV